MIIVLDAEKAEAKLASGGMSCASCGQPLAPWGYSHERSVTDQDAAMVPVRPRRARCRGCGTTHVVLPALLPPRCPVTVEVVGQVLLGAAQGAGHRLLAERLSLPPGTVRRWLRSARANAESFAGSAPSPPTSRPGAAAAAAQGQQTGRRG